MQIRPITFKEACAFVNALHRHHKAPQGHKFSLGLMASGKLVGVVIVGRPVNRNLDNGLVCEVTRLCTDGTKNAASKLYGAARRVAFAMGYQRVVTYILASEPGTSLSAAGWERDGPVHARSWSTPTRPRKAPPTPADKVRYSTQAEVR